MFKRSLSDCFLREHAFSTIWVCLGIATFCDMDIPFPHLLNLSDRAEIFTWHSFALFSAGDFGRFYFWSVNLDLQFFSCREPGFLKNLPYFFFIKQNEAKLVKTLKTITEIYMELPLKTFLAGSDDFSSLRHSLQCRNREKSFLKSKNYEEGLRKCFPRR